MGLSMYFENEKPKSLVNLQKKIRGIIFQGEVPLMYFTYALTIQIK